MDLYGRLLHDVLFPGFEALRNRPTVALQRYLDHTQWASSDELHAIQSGLLRRLIRHAWHHTRHYREVLERAGLGPDDLRGPEDLVRLPLLDKDTLRASRETRRADAPPYAVIDKVSSGSTGEPTTVSYNAESRHWRDATRWRGYGWAGYRIGQRALHYWGFGVTPPKSRWKRAKVELDHRLKRDLYIDCTPRSDEHLAHVVDEIRRYRPEVIVTYSQAGATLARYVTRTGARTWGTIPVICGAERVFDHDREALTEAFGPAVFETYGSREVMLMAAECEAHDGMHLAMETQILEVVVREPDGSSRPAAPGEAGEVVVTDLHNLASPLIRYLNGDRAVQRAPSRCACGRWLSRLGPIEGRVTETLRDGAGNPVSGLIFNILFVYITETAKQFQVVQRADDTVVLRIVPDGEIRPDARAQMLAYLGRYLPGVPVEIEAVDDIPLGPAGKRRLVVVEPRAT
ncbi:MAG: phenylacetate--CoA ligase family protein [Kofleriaceae bacterium]|nr:phenylacetate--CoA ligase family protein [Myxococcales bacterium]MCB9560335.1 phenylacetate--CoA ligase family protein [Kofleriaceae bacterium]MCB9571735.1 phenylacetate--CoA ligase family protein [Kofleriaceae bacterium]